uniref:Alternative protein TSPYL4 n=1 Tax=Homo sapiens TaxID=9606 RepID=L0R5G4_HUMAN|nr:alternative protein TSPYL4 [Homo sapiens]
MGSGRVKGKGLCDVSKGNQNLASLHFSKDGNSFLGLGLLLG